MRRLRSELSQLVNRSVDRHVRIAVTGLSRSGKTAFITSLVNQLLHVQSGARLPLFSAAREGRLLGAKRIPQKHFNIPRFAYDESIAALYHSPPQWPIPTSGISEICLQLRYRSQHSLLRHVKNTANLYVEIIDYPGEWLLDLPMLTQDYFSWSRQMQQLLKDRGNEGAQQWLQLCQQCDPFAAADEKLLASIAQAYTDYLVFSKQQGQYFIHPGRFILPGDLAGAPVLQFFPWLNIDTTDEQKLKQADKQSNIGMLQQRYNYYCQKIIKRFYKEYFQHFDRQIVLVDCLTALNNGSAAFNDMQNALTQIMRSFHYGKRTLLRRMFSPRIDKLLFAASKADHITHDQQANLVSLLQQLVRTAWQNAAFEGISLDCIALASIQATENGRIEYQGEQLPALKGHRLSDGQLMTFFPGEVPRRLPNADFWLKQGFDFESFLPRETATDQPVAHIRLDSALEFLLGDKLK
ncbi:MAG TPA: YcjX family protein [Arsenophonus apicola]|uniref:YcjX family protein n=1 Tax=Arsenophonus apicola TaxID=2879119 RepID=UPI0038799466